MLTDALQCISHPAKLIVQLYSHYQNVVGLFLLALSDVMCMILNIAPSTPFWYYFQN